MFLLDVRSDAAVLTNLVWRFLVCLAMI
jgi:hypothetical protein